MRPHRDTSPSLQAILLACTLVAMTAWHPPSSRAQEQERATDIITIGVENIMHLPYYGLCGRDYCGYARDLLDTFARDEGLTIRYRAMPIPRLHRNLVNGTVDAKFPAHPEWAGDIKKDAAVLYSDPVVTFTDGYMSHGHMKGAPRKVGTIRGFTVAFHGLPRPPAVIEANAEKDLFNLLLRGRVEAIYTNIGVMRAYLTREKVALDNIVFRRDLPFRQSRYYLSTATNPALVKRFNNWMARSQPMLQDLQARHGIKQID